MDATELRIFLFGAAGASALLVVIDLLLMSWVAAGVALLVGGGAGFFAVRLDSGPAPAEAPAPSVPEAPQQVAAESWDDEVPQLWVDDSKPWGP